MNEIFKAYDIRGIYPSEINETLVENIGKAFVTYTSANKIAVASDMRTSSPSLLSALIKGITDAGADVINLGLLSTPMLYFASSRLPIDGAIMVTASHNPGEYNGLKLCRKNAIPIGLETGLSEIRDIALSMKFSSVTHKGEISEFDIKPEYDKYISSFAKFENKKFHIATDTAHAMGVLELPVFEILPGITNCGRLYDTLQVPGICPHEANPLKSETLSELQHVVIKTKSDIGIAFDGDADRIGFIDEKGRVIPMDLITALLAQSLSHEHKNATALYDLRSSRSVKEEIEKIGWHANESKVGHANIKSQMIKEGAILAGEVSGHYYFSIAGYIAEMGSLPAILLLNLMARTNKKLSFLVDSVQKYSHSGEMNLSVHNASKIIDAIKLKYSDANISERDGVKATYPTWWFSLRSSNTEPLLRLNVEADSRELMEEKVTELSSCINEYNS